MSLLSSVVINMLEKELAAQVPEVEALALKLIDHLAKELVIFVEKKTGMKAQEGASSMLPESNL